MGCGVDEVVVVSMVEAGKGLASGFAWGGDCGEVRFVDDESKVVDVGGCRMCIRMCVNGHVVIGGSGLCVGSVLLCSFGSRSAVNTVPVVGVNISSYSFEVVCS